MHIGTINRVLSVAKRFEDPESAFNGRSDRDVCLLHACKRETGDQNLLFLDGLERWFEIPQVYKELTFLLGCYTVDRAVWQLAIQKDQYEGVLTHLHPDKKVVSTAFRDELIKRLLRHSKLLQEGENPPEEEEVWKLCLAEEQEVYLPNRGSDRLDIVPGRVLASLLAPSGLAGSVQLFIQGEEELEGKIQQEFEIINGHMADLLRGMFGEGEEDQI